LAGISKAQFDYKAQLTFKTITAAGAGIVCGKDGKSMCVANDVSIVAYARRSSVSVQFHIQVAASKAGQAATTMNTYIGGSDFKKALVESGGTLAAITSTTVTSVPKQGTAPAPPPIVNSIQCYNSRFVTILSGGFDEHQLKSNGWSSDQIEGWTKVPTCAFRPRAFGGEGASCKTSMSSLTTKVTCSGSASVAPTCVKYQGIVEATDQTGSNLKYRVSIASCGGPGPAIQGLHPMCDSLTAFAASSVKTKEDPEATSFVQLIGGCEACEGELCNIANNPSTAASSTKEDDSVSASAYIGMAIGGILLSIAMIFVAKDCFSSCALYGEPAYKVGSCDDKL
jgi:hypothetical protein